MIDLDTDDVRYERDGHVATLTFDRPAKKNALTTEMVRESLRAIRDAEDDQGVRVLVVTGAGRDFCAGGDLEELIPGDAENADPAALGPDAEAWGFSLRYETVTTPIVAAVTGTCVGAGMEFLQATDLRVAGESAQFGHQEPRWGLFPAGGATVRLPRQIPYVEAMRILLTGDRFPAEYALRINLVNEVVADDRVLGRARELAGQVAANGPMAVRRIKESVVRNAGRPTGEAFELETELARDVWASDEAKEGVEAFLDDRDPDFGR